MKTEKQKLALKLANHSFAPSDAAEAVQTSHDARRLAQLVLEEGRPFASTPTPASPPSAAERAAGLSTRLLAALEDAEAAFEQPGLTPNEEASEVDPLLLAIRTAAALTEERLRVEELLRASDEEMTAAQLVRDELVQRANQALNYREALGAELRAVRAFLLQEVPLPANHERIQRIEKTLRFAGIEVER